MGPSPGRQGVLRSRPTSPALYPLPDQDGHSGDEENDGEPLRRPQNGCDQRVQRSGQSQPALEDPSAFDHACTVASSPPAPLVSMTSCRDAADSRHTRTRRLAPLFDEQTGSTVQGRDNNPSPPRDRKTVRGCRHAGGRADAHHEPNACGDSGLEVRGQMTDRVGIEELATDRTNTSRCPARGSSPIQRGMRRRERRHHHASRAPSCSGPRLRAAQGAARTRTSGRSPLIDSGSPE